jgi:Transposase
MTIDWLALSAWLAAAGVTHVARESTGEYWKPVLNIWEGSFTVFPVNAAHVKPVPGRKTDRADARWLARLMRYRLLRASFIPPAPQHDVRDLTRYRTKLAQERGREVNRVQGVLARANMKLAAVAPNLSGGSGRAILAALIEGRADAVMMAELAKGRLRRKIPRLEQALTGLVREPHRRLLTIPRAHLDMLDEPIEALSEEITGALTDLPGGEPPSTPAVPSLPEEPNAAPARPQVPLTFARGQCAGDDSWRHPTGRSNAGGRVGHRHGALWCCGAAVGLERRRSRERRERRPTALGQDPSGQSGLAGGPGAMGPRRGPHQRPLSVDVVSPRGGTPWAEAGHPGGGACDRGQGVP